MRMRRLARRHGAGRRASTAARSSPKARRQAGRAARRARSPGSSSPASGGSPCRRGAPTIAASFTVRGAAQHNLKGIDVEFPVGKFVCVTGVSGSGKSTLVNEIVYKALANRLNRMRVKPGEHDAVEGIEVFDKVIEIDQTPIGRTPRSNPATYTDLFTHVRELYSLTPGGEGARLQAGPLLVQRARRPLRDVQGRRDDQDRDALPARRLRALRDLPRPALQQGDARGPLQGQVDRRRARDVGRGGARVLRQDPEDPPAPADAARRRARLRQARPAGDDALRAARRSA